jgi:hypothetical protein
MKSPLLAMVLLAALACPAAAFDAASTQSYVAARDKYLARFKRYENDPIPKKASNEEEHARQDLAGALRRALGPAGPKGFSGAGKLNQPTLIPGGEDSDAIDGLVFWSDDKKVQLLHTAGVLVENWLSTHKETLVNNALAMGTKDPIKDVLFEKPSKSRDAKVADWLAHHTEVAQDVAGFIDSEVFYAGMFDFGAAVVKYAEIPVTKAAETTSAYAVLAAHQQDIGSYVPDEIMVTVMRGPDVYVLRAKAAVAVEKIPACEAIWQAVVKQREQGDGQKSDKAGDADAPEEIEDAGDKAFHRCFAEKAKDAKFYAPLRRQAQALVERVEQK